MNSFRVTALSSFKAMSQRREQRLFRLHCPLGQQPVVNLASRRLDGPDRNASNPRQTIQQTSAAAVSPLDGSQNATSLNPRQTSRQVSAGAASLGLGPIHNPRPNSKR